MSDSSHEIESLANREYKWGFVTDIEQDTVPPGLDESVIAHISAKKVEPEWMLEWRLEAYRHWLTAPCSFHYSFRHLHLELTAYLENKYDQI